MNPDPDLNFCLYACKFVGKFDLVLLISCLLLGFVLIRM